MKLQFKHQPFQAEAAAAVCDVFRGQPMHTAACPPGMADAGFRNHPLAPGLTDARILDNLRAVQRRGGLEPSDTLAGPGINLSVEMETGTGKTYTYVKTIYELNARYGWSRFIIVVPSVAIREGVYKALQTTREHFAGEYGKKLRFFIYSSDRLAEVDRFASDSAIQVMIINMQAFNSSKNRRIIDKRLDAFRGRRPIDVIARTNPILIIDEPQSVEGRQTREGLKKFFPLFTLRYSATHREKYDMVYRLDAVDAYNQRLVKKIAALGVTLTGSSAAGGYVYLEGVDLCKGKAPTARLGFDVKGNGGTRTVVRRVRGGDDLFALSHGLEEYADRFVILPDGIDGRDNSVTFLNGLKLYAGQIRGGGQLTALQRRVQIRETIRTHIRRERELYPRGVKVLSLFFIDEVAKYRVYDGDSDDGRNGEYARMFEEEYNDIVGGLQREIGDGAYLDYLDRIPVRETHQGYFSIDRKKGGKARFVEGKLDRKAQTSDDADAYDLIMRDKERLLSLDEPVRFIFSHSALREGWDNPNVFQICTLKPQSESEIRSRQEIGRGLRLSVNQQGERMDESVLGGQVQELNKLTLVTDLSFGRFAQALQAGLDESLAGGRGGQGVGLEDAHSPNVEARADPDKLKSREFQALWEQISRKSYYTVSFDTEELVRNAIDRLNARLEVSQVFVRREYGELEARGRPRGRLLPGEGFRPREAGQDPAGHFAHSGARYDLVGKLVEETGLTRATAAAILAGMAPQKFAMFRLNPEEFILKTAGIINSEKAAAVIGHIAYHRLDAAYDTGILTAARPRGRLGQNAIPAERGVYDYLVCDSDAERRFAGQLEENDQVALYVKLPKSFFIPTPVGKYSPGWAIALREGSARHTCLVAETRGGRDAMEPGGTEEVKLACARAHFAAISGGSVTCDVVTDLEQLLNLVS